MTSQLFSLRRFQGRSVKRDSTQNISDSLHLQLNRNRKLVLVVSTSSVLNFQTLFFFMFLPNFWQKKLPESISPLFRCMAKHCSLNWGGWVVTWHAVAVKKGEGDHQLLRPPTQTHPNPPTSAANKQTDKQWKLSQLDSLKCTTPGILRDSASYSHSAFLAVQNSSIGDLVTHSLSK